MSIYEDIIRSQTSQGHLGGKSGPLGKMFSPDSKKKNTRNDPVRNDYFIRWIDFDVQKGEDLVAKDRNGFSDPFLIISFTDYEHKLLQKETTKVIQKSLNPEWNETMTVPQSHRAKYLKIECWDKDRIGKDFMGEFEIELEKFEMTKEDKSGENKKIELTLEGKPAGYITFSWKVGSPTQKYLDEKAKNMPKESASPLDEIKKIEILVDYQKKSNFHTDLAKLRSKVRNDLKITDDVLDDWQWNEQDCENIMNWISDIKTRDIREDWVTSITYGSLTKNRGLNDNCLNILASFNEIQKSYTWKFEGNQITLESEEVCDKIMKTKFEDANKSCATLVNLDLSYNKVTAKGLATMGPVLRELTDINLTGNPLDQECIQFLADLLAGKYEEPEKYVKMANEIIKGEFERNFRTKNLHEKSPKKLFLSDCGITDDGVKVLCDAIISQDLKPEHIAGILVELDISDNQISEIGGEFIVQLLAKNPRITTLNLSHNNFGSEFGQKLISVIENHPKLTTVELKKCGVSDEDLKKIEELLKPANIRVREGIFKKEKAKQEAEKLLPKKLEAIEEFIKSIEDSEDIKDKPLLIWKAKYYIHHHASAVSVNVNQANNVTMNNIAGMIYLLENNETSEILDLTLVKMTEEDDWSQFCEALKKNETTKILKLPNTWHIKGFWESFATVLSENNRIKEIYFSSNGTLSGEAIKCLNKSLPKSQIEILEISGCSSSPKFDLKDSKLHTLRINGAGEFNPILSLNPSLSILDLSETILRGTGCKELCSSLLENNLTELNLAKCRIADSGSEALAPVLKRSTTLEILDVSNNFIDDFMSSFVNAICENNSIKKVNFKGNNQKPNAEQLQVKKIEFEV